MSVEQHYKLPDLAERLGLHPETLRRAIHRGELRARRVGMDFIIPDSWAAEWLEQRNVPQPRARVVPMTRPRR